MLCVIVCPQSSFAARATGTSGDAVSVDAMIAEPNARNVVVRMEPPFRFERRADASCGPGRVKRDSIAGGTGGQGQTIGGVHCCAAPLSSAALPPPSIAPNGVWIPFKKFATARFFVSVDVMLSTL